MPSPRIFRGMLQLPAAPYMTNEITNFALKTPCLTLGNISRQIPLASISFLTKMSIHTAYVSNGGLHDKTCLEESRGSTKTSETSLTSFRLFGLRSIGEVWSCCFKSRLVLPATLVSEFPTKPNINPKDLSPSVGHRQHDQNIYLRTSIDHDSTLIS